MSKPVIKFKTYRQAAAVGGKIYGVPNLGDPVVAEVTMQEVIDYAKLHNYSADTLSALLSQVIAGVGDLVARDGRPRMLSDLLKFEPVIKGTFDNLEQTVTNQKVLVRPRMLKEIKVALDPSEYSWQNQNDKDTPRIISVAPLSSAYSTLTKEAFLAAVNNGSDAGGFGFTFAGDRLCPNGWDANCSLTVEFSSSSTTAPSEWIHLESRASGSMEGEFFGIFSHATADDASQNAVVVSRRHSEEGYQIYMPAWYLNGGVVEGVQASALSTYLQTVTKVKFTFTRRVATGDVLTAEKIYTF